MTLKDIVARLELIGAATEEIAICPDCDEEVPVDRTACEEAIARLVLDIERHILRTEGTLTP